MTMTLAKLKIKPLKPSVIKPIYVQFNPNSYSITKAVTWCPPKPPLATSDSTATAAATAANHRDLDAPSLTFGGGGASTLSLQLFYDVTDKGADADVRTETRKIVELTRIERGQIGPPVCEVSWGVAKDDLDFPFPGAVSSLTQNFVLFRQGGQPVRANLTVAFTEINDAETNKKKIDPDLTTYLVKRGDTLSSIATAQYRDPALWREIAAANDIDNPRDLARMIGQRLAIPQI